MTRDELRAAAKLIAVRGGMLSGDVNLIRAAQRLAENFLASEPADGGLAKALQQQLEIALAKFNEADKERLRETDERRAEAEKWRSEGDMYGWNFHQGVSAGCTTASIIFHRVKRSLETALAGLGIAAKEKS